MIYIIMGVSGSGKSTIGKLLAQKLELDFYDADNFHPQNNLNKMTQGYALDDIDREPWLLLLASKIIEWNLSKGAVLACSALKKSYREILSSDQKNVVYIHLEGNQEIIIKRINARSEHFFPSILLQSQFNSLERPTNAITINIEKSPENICKEILNGIRNKGFLQ